MRRMKRTYGVAILISLAAVALTTSQAYARHYMMGTGANVYPAVATPMPPSPAMPMPPTAAPPLAAAPRPHVGVNIYPAVPKPGPHPDGPNLYQYVRSNPIAGLDPSGEVMVVLSGAGQSEGSMDSLRNATQTEIETRVAKWFPGSNLKLKIINHAKQGLTGDYDALLRADYEAFIARRKKQPCSLEQFVAIGHSSGASAISNEIVAGTFRPVFVDVPGYGQRRISPIFFGLVDQILGNKNLHAARVAALGFRTSMLHYKQYITTEVKGVKNINILKDHFSIVNDNRVVNGISKLAGADYESWVKRDREKTRNWIRFTPHW